MISRRITGFIRKLHSDSASHIRLFQAQRAFALFDVNGNGLVDKREMYVNVCIIYTYIEHIRLFQAHRVFALFDVNGNGLVDKSKMYMNVFMYVCVYDVNRKGSYRQK